MLVAVSAMHGRHAITEAWAEHTDSLGFDAVYVAITTDDEANAETCERHGFKYCFIPNEPLAQKFNAAMGMALANPFDKAMILPSDDFISQEWFTRASTTTEDYIIPHECAIVDAPSQQAYKITRIHAGTLMFGASRVISRWAIEKVGELWPIHLERGLDTGSHNRLREAGFNLSIIKTETMSITDVKTSDNLWGYSTWLPGSRTLTADQALHMVSPEVRAKLDKLKTF